MFTRLIKIFLLLLIITACDADEKYSFSDIPFIYGSVRPDSNPQWPLMFYLGYVPKHSDNAYNSFPHKPIYNADVTLFWNQDSIKLTSFGDDEYIDYRYIDLKARPMAGDYVGVKAVFDSEILFWDGYLPLNKPVCTNLPVNGDTIVIQIKERVRNFMEIPGIVKDRGFLYVELNPTDEKKLKHFGFGIRDNQEIPYFDYFTFKDSIIMPVYVDTTDEHIELEVIFGQIDSSIAAAYLLDGYIGNKDQIICDDELKIYLDETKRLSLKQRSNVKGDGVGLISHQNSDIRRLTARILR